MPSPATLDRPSAVSDALARTRPGVPSVLLFLLGTAAPLTVVAGVTTVGYAVTGATGMPLAILVVAAVLALFSVGYLAMTRRMTHAAAFHSHVARGLGRPAGVGAAWVGLIAYNSLQVGLYGLVGAATAPLLAHWFDLAPQWWVVALAAWVLVGAVGALRADLGGVVLTLLLVAEVAAILLFGLGHLLDPAGGSVGAATLAPGHLLAPGVGALLVVAAVGFVGFESAVVLGEERRCPKRTLPVATVLFLTVVAVVYAFSAWTMAVATGPERIVGAARDQGPELLFDLAGQHFGDTVARLGLVVFALSVLAALVAFHRTCARYAFTLGRERLLPAAFGQADPRTGVPRVASVAQSLLAFVVIAVWTASGADPVRHLFHGSVAVGAFGVLLLTAGTSLAVIVFFAREATDETRWRRVVAPGLAAVALIGVVAVAVADFGTLLGVAPDSALRWAVPTVFPVAAGFGVLWALVLRARRPRAYARIGLGAESVAVELFAAPPGR